MIPGAREVAEAALPDPFSSDTITRLISAAERLLMMGFTETEASDLLADVVGAVRGEYGE